MARIIISISIFIFCIASIIAASLHTLKNAEHQKNYRLPNNTKPIAYDIYINTRIDEGIFGFNGTVKIEIDVLEESKHITLHQRQLSINSVELTNESHHLIPIIPAHYDSDTEFMTISPTNEILSANSTVFLTINYNGTLRRDLQRFYEIFYLDSNSKRVYDQTL